jgi:serine/threonine protein kinase
MLLKIGTKEYNINDCQQIGYGGEAKVYATKDNQAIKVYHDYDSEVEKKLRGCLAYGNYGLIDHVAVPPTALALNDKSQVMGYAMKLLRPGYISVADIANTDYCKRNNVSLRRSGALFYYIHRAIKFIHSKRFIIGDLRGQNIRFRPSEKRDWDIAFMDVDSWRAPYGDSWQDHYCTAIHPSVMHPSLYDQEDFSQLAQKHDWYAFAHQFATSLIKCDPFAKGRYSNWTSERRKAEGITCFGSQVTLTDEEKLLMSRIGDNMTNLLRRWLDGSADGIFPVKEIITFTENLKLCPKCGLESHASKVGCPQCYTRL